MLPKAHPGSALGHACRPPPSLDQAERDFSADAQAIGIGPAFCKHGAPDAMNFGGPSPAIVSGVGNISHGFGEAAAPGEPKSPVSWAPDDVLVAASGDLGITWGFLKPNGPVPAGRPAASPYSTIWWRSGPDQPWKYIAE